MKDLTNKEILVVQGAGVSASEAAGASCAAAVIGAAALVAGTGGLGAFAAWSIGLAGCTGFGTVAVTSGN